MSDTNHTPEPEQNAVQNGQSPEGEVMKRKPWFEIAADRGKWHWCLWSGNGRQMACNVTPYKSQSECKSAIEAFINALGGRLPRVFVAQDDG